MTVPADMTAIAIAAPGGPQVLAPVRAPVPARAEDEILIRVAAAGINGADLGQRRGGYRPPPDASPLLGLEVSGAIAALGPGADGWTVGEPVVALTNGGGYAEYVAVPAGQVLPLPKGWSLVAGAALPETFFTVQQALVMRGGLRAGQDILVHGAAGGLGWAAIQMANILRARPIAVVGGHEKARYACHIGATKVIDHAAGDVVARVREITGGKGADVILEMAGGDSLVRSIEAAAIDGHIAVVAALSGTPAPVNAGAIVMKRLTIAGSTLRPQSRDTKAAIAAALRQTVWPALGAGSVVRPRIRAFPLEQAARAHVEMERRGNYGKLLLLTAFGRDQLAANPDNSIELI